MTDDALRPPIVAGPAEPAADAARARWIAAGYALLAVLMWSSYAFIVTRLGALPPLLLLAMAMLIAAATSSPAARSWRVPWRIHALGVAGIGGNTLLYFVAFRFAPAVEVNLVNYTWPLLIILATPLFLRGERLRAHHVLGALIGFAGAAVVILAGHGADPAALGARALVGYGLCLLGAITWTCYSLTTKRLPPFPTAALGGFCLTSGVLLLAAHVLSSARGGAAAAVDAVVAPLAALGAREWILLLLCGVGPLGLAYLAWDRALRRGDPRVNASIAFLTPLLSTAILTLAGHQRFTATHALSVALIVGGAVIGSWDRLAPRRAR